MIYTISGKMKAGKDTTAILFNILLNNKKDTPEEIFIKYKMHGSLVLDKQYEIKHWKTNVKKVCSILSGIPLHKWNNEYGKDAIMPEEWHHNNYKPTYREFMQKIDIEIGRQKIQENVWILSLLNSYNSNNNWIIADTRFMNEILAVKKKKGKSIYIERIRTYDENIKHFCKTNIDNIPFSPNCTSSKLYNEQEFMRECNIDTIQDKHLHTSELELFVNSADYCITAHNITDIIVQLKTIMIKENLL